MTDDDLTVGSTTYTVFSLRYGPEASDGDSKLHLTLDKELTTADKGSLSLRVGDRSFPLSSAVMDEGSVDDGNNYTWTGVTTQPWTVGTVVSVKITDD